MGTTIPTSGSRPDATAAGNPANGTSRRWQELRSSTKYVHGLWRTAYASPPSVVAQADGMPSAYTPAVWPLARARPNTDGAWIGWLDGSASSVMPNVLPPAIAM